MSGFVADVTAHFRPLLTVSGDVASFAASIATILLLLAFAGKVAVFVALEASFTSTATSETAVAVASTATAATAAGWALSGEVTHSITLVASA